MQIPGFLCLPTFLIIIIFQEWFALIPFGVLAVLSFGIGQLLQRTLNEDQETESGSSYALISLIWFLLPLMGTIPFLGIAWLMPDTNEQVAIFTNFHNALFESMSGFTGTGLSMLNDSSVIPHSLQWWRSVMEWVGGLGIMFLAVAILDTAHHSESLYQSEAMGWKSQSKDPQNKIMKIIWIYLAYTAVSIILFLIAGMPFWEALNHGITGIATGGFSITKDSFASYTDTIKWMAVPVMLLGAFSFKIHVLLVEGNWKKLAKQTQLKYFTVIFLVMLTLIFFSNPAVSYVDMVFQLASAIGTCGFSSSDLTTWTPFFLFPLVIAMFLGGNSSSTTGGVKTQRIAWLWKSLRENIRQTLTPDKEKEEFELKITYNGEKVDNQQAFKKIRIAAILLFGWIFSIFTGTLVLSYMLHNYEHSFFDILFEVTSAFNNVGLSSGVTGAELPASAKWLLSIIMWVGRLEILGVIVMFAFFIKKK